MPSTLAQLDDDDDSLQGAVPGGSAAKKRGRPSLIETSALLYRRDDLLPQIENKWAEFAWELRRAKGHAEIRRALQPFRERREFELFVSESTKFATWEGLRKTKAETANLLKRLRLAIEDEKATKVRLDSALSALRSSGSDSRFEQLCEERTRRHASAIESTQRLRSNHENMADTLRRTEAHISQAELLDFLISRRYALAPLALANAMAGLPLIAWRQSLNRCASSQPGTSGALSYQTFELLARLFAGPPKTAQRAIDQARAFLIKKRRRPGPVIQILKDEFYFLRASIEAVYIKKPHKSAIPYRVAAEYSRRRGTRSVYDQMMAEEDRL